MSYRVLIPTAGTGSRLGDKTRYINKSLVSVANRPVISHIIELFPDEVEFVLALGHKGALVKDFLSLAYPDRTFFFSQVSPFEGAGSGLGLSIIACKEYLQQPFVFISCDTLVRNKIPNPDHNWMGYADVDDLAQYRTIELDDNRVRSICEKGVGSKPTHKPYIGLAGINDYKIFWDSMDNGGNLAIDKGEAYGLISIIEKGIETYCFNWFDTGNPEALEATRQIYREENAPNILEKPDEAIWFIENNVIKYSDDVNFINNRVERSQDLKGFIPAITGVKKNMYRYTKADGSVMSSVVTLPLFEKLLSETKNLWVKRNLTSDEKWDFKNSCMDFYKVKTEDRIKRFYKTFLKEDGIETINGIKMPKIEKLLSAVDWSWIADGLPGRFHGDFHFENIVYSSVSNKFTFLDWRQDFAGSLSTGDIYYDLAKLLHGLIICHELIAANNYWIDWQKNDISYDFHRKQILVECENYFMEWLNKNGYDQKKVVLLTALVFLNIAALHHYPYSLLLYTLGKHKLFDVLEYT